MLSSFKAINSAVGELVGEDGTLARMHLVLQFLKDPKGCFGVIAYSLSELFFFLVIK